MDLYEILGVRRGAGGGEIRRAYRRLARRYHPDVNPGDREAQARYALITRAFETLNDPERRRAYDAGVPLEPAEPAQSYGFEGFDFSVQASVGAEASTFGELFADVLTRTLGGGEAGPQRGAHLHAAFSVSLAEVLTGTERQVPLTRHVACRTCLGRASCMRRRATARPAAGPGASARRAATWCSRGPASGAEAAAS